MDRMHIGKIAALACATLLACAHANAQARGHSMQEFLQESRLGETPEIKIPEMDAWLRRLVGRFRYEGSMTFPGGPAELRGVKGTRDCVGIGPGPGVQCIINMVWPETGAGGAFVLQTLNPAMSLYGIDPNDPAFKFLQVDNRGIPEGGDGKLRGDLATFRVPCVNTPPGCLRILKIRASADGGEIETQMETWRNYYKDMRPSVSFSYLLRRVPAAPPSRN